MKTLHLLFYINIILISQTFSQDIPLDGRGGGIISYQRDFDIYASNLDGSGEYNLTNSRSLDLGARWSSDGNSIFFLSNTEGVFDIYRIDVIDIENKTFDAPIKITTNLNTYEFSISPQDDKIAYINNGTGFSSIELITLEGEYINSIQFDDINPFQISWGPVNDILVFASQINNTNQLYSISLDGSHLQQLTTLGGYVPQWSPDGHEIVFVSVRYGSEDIFIINSDGSNERRITTNPNHDFVPHWSPDGEKIIYQHSSGSGDDIYIINKNGTNDTRVTYNSGNETFPSWRPPIDTSLYRGTVSDYDGNIYETVRIGNQIWMAENLRSTHYSDGTPIENFFYNNDTNNVSIYGRLYKCRAAMRNVASSNMNPSLVQGASPDGWHIPSEAEWKELIDFLGDESVAGGKLKQAGFDHWNTPNTGATNEYGFSALPTGWYDFTGSYMGLGSVCFFRTSNYSSNGATAFEISSGSALINQVNLHPDDAIPIRCVKDDPTTETRQTSNILPNSFELYQNYPNPFNPNTIIEYTLTESSDIKIIVYDILGRNLRILVDQYMPSGNHQITWDGKDNFNRKVSTGVYFYQLTYDSFAKTKIMMLLE